MKTSKESTPLLGKKEPVKNSHNGKKNTFNHAPSSPPVEQKFMAYRQPGQSATTVSKSAPLKFLQVVLLVLLVIDLVSLIAMVHYGLSSETFWNFQWLTTTSTEKTVEGLNLTWRFWGLPVIITFVKCIFFTISAFYPAFKCSSIACVLLSVAFLFLLAVDSVKLDAFSIRVDEEFELAKAGIANSLPLIFTVLELLNLNFLVEGQGVKKESLPTIEDSTVTTDDGSISLPPPRYTHSNDGIGFYQMLHILKPYFWPHGVPNRIRAGSTYIILIASKIMNLMSPLYIAKATNALLERDTKTAWINLCYFCGFVFLSKLFKECQSLIYLRVKQTAYIELATLTYEHVHSLSYDWHVQKKLGDVLRSMDRGVESANSMVSYVFLYLFPTLAEAVVVVIIFAVHFRLAAISFLAFTSLVLYSVFTVQITLWRKKFREATNKHDNAYHDKATDALINYETIKYFTNERYEIDTYAKVIEKYQQFSVSVTASLSILNVGQALIIQLTVLITLCLAAPHVINDESDITDNGKSIDIGAFIAISVYLSNLFQPLSFLGSIYNMVIKAIVDMKKLNDLLSVPQDVEDLPDAQPLKVNENDLHNGIGVTFDNIYFQYPAKKDGKSGIHSVSFHIAPGTTTALVGETGAGKTTISRLLFRFYDPASGAIYVNNQDIRCVTQYSLRKVIGIVPQDTVLFNDSIYNNIKYGKLEASFEDVVQAAKNARIYDFIMSLPKQWQEIVGERGLKLSGGEKQRVAIARTLLKDPPLVVLDEATSALDTVTEREIQAALNRLKSNRTLMIIAHRLSTIRNAHQILVFSEGRIVERGTHDELLKLDNGIYERMWSAQRRSENEINDNAQHD